MHVQDMAASPPHSVEHQQLIKHLDALFERATPRLRRIAALQHIPFDSLDDVVRRRSSRLGSTSSSFAVLTVSTPGSTASAATSVSARG